MELTPTERAQVVVRHISKKHGLSQGEIGSRLGYSDKSTLSAMLNGHKAIPRKFAQKFAELFPEVNPDFLTGASDDMLVTEHADVPELFVKDAQPEKQKEDGVFLPMPLVQLFTDMAATIRSQQETLRQIVEKKNPGEKVG